MSYVLIWEMLSQKLVIGKKIDNEFEHLLFFSLQRRKINDKEND